jgi:hypothetical protein
MFIYFYIFISVKKKLCGIIDKIIPPAGVIEAELISPAPG